jgi:hypothetical protein
MPRVLTRWPNATEIPLGPSPVSSGVRQHVTRLMKLELAVAGVSKSTRQIIPHFSLLVRTELLNRQLNSLAWSDMADMHSDSNVGSDASTVSLVGTRGGKLGIGFVIVSAWPVASTTHAPMATIIRNRWHHLQCSRNMVGILNYLGAFGLINTGGPNPPRRKQMMPPLRSPRVYRDSEARLAECGRHASVRRDACRTSTEGRT